MDRHLFQVAYFVSDLTASIHKWADEFGAGPFFVAWHHKTDEFSYRGTAQEADVSYAFGYLGDMMIQLIQQHDDTPSIYRDMYADGEEGYHHIAYLVSDFAAERQRWLDMGYALASELYADEVNAAYFDTRAMNGGFTEIHGDPQHIQGMFGIWKRTHEAWDGKSSPIIDGHDMLPVYRRAPMMPLKA